MAVHIRLARAGTKKNPFYRVVVADQRSPRGGRFIERLGTYDPQKSDASALTIDNARVTYWTGKGAQPSETVAVLIKTHAALVAAAAK